MTTSLGIAFLGCCTVFFLLQSLLGLVGNRRNRVRHRLEQYLEQPEQEKDGPQRAAPSLRAWLGRLGAAFGRRHYREAVEQKLIQAHLLFRPEEFIGMQLVAGVGGFALGILGSSAPLALLGGIAGFFGPMLYLQQTKAKRATSFNQQIGEALVLMANSLKAGYGLLQAMEVVGKEMQPPIAQEFSQVLKEINLGVGTEEALQNMALRVKSDDWDLVLTAVLIQRQVGGNLAEILENIASTIRERIRIQREIKTLTAQGRLSGFIIAMLPFALGAFLLVSNPSYIMILFRHPLGMLMLGGAIVAQVVGVMLIKKIVQIEV